MIYLDTHVIVWLYAGMVEKLSARARELINQNEIYISPVVQLELQYLFEIDRIKDDGRSVVAYLSDRIGLEVCDKRFKDIVRNAEKFFWTRDPLDRIIVANAAIDDNLLLTKDQTILNNYKNAVWL